MTTISWSVAGCFALFGLDGYGPPHEGSDDGGLPAADAADAADDGSIAPVTLTGKVVFVTSAKFDGALGGLAKADARCQTLATSAGLSGTFKAWLSDGDESPSSRFSSAGEAGVGPRLVTPDRRRIIAPSLAAMATGLVAPIAMTETGETLPGGEVSLTGDDEEPCVFSGEIVWTNTSPRGVRTSLTDCDSWSTNESTSTGPAGVVLRADAGASDDWTLACPQPCSTLAHLYCFEQ